MARGDSWDGAKMEDDVFRVRIVFTSGTTRNLGPYASKSAAKGVATRYRAGSNVATAEVEEKLGKWVDIG